jgi:hypothetical protein
VQVSVPVLPVQAAAQDLQAAVPGLVPEQEPTAAVLPVFRMLTEQTYCITLLQNPLDKAA